MGALLLLPLLALSNATAQHADRPGTIAVMQTEVSGGIDRAVGQQVTARLAETLRQKSGATVISNDELLALLDHERDVQLMGCTDNSCLAELANALGAEAIVTARLSPIDGGLALALSLVDSRTATVRARVNESYGGDAMLVLALVAPLVDKLVAQSNGEPVPTGTIEIVGAVDGSTVLVDDVAKGATPLAALTDIPVGAHRITLHHEGLAPFAAWAIVERGAAVSVVAAQEKPAPPFYTTWWFWTGAGVAAASATAVGIAWALSSGGGPTGVDVQVDAKDFLPGASR